MALGERSKWESMLGCEEAGLLQHSWWRAAIWIHSRSKLQPGQGLWSPTLVLEKQDSGTQKLCWHSSHAHVQLSLGKCFQTQAACVSVFCRWNMKLPTGHSLKSWIWWLLWVHSSSKYFVILNLNSLSKTVWASRAFRDSKTECRWWCEMPGSDAGDGPAQEQSAAALLPIPGVSRPLYFIAIIPLWVNDINVCIQM